MAISPRLIRRRIRSVSNTRKITRAMELVAAAKMRRAVAAALKTRAYANLAWNMIDALHGAVPEATHPLLRTTASSVLEVGNREEPVRAMYIIMASDRGLCGGFNAALFRELLRDVRDSKFRVPSSRFVAVGKKSEQFVRRQGWNLIASFIGLAVAPTIAELRPVARIAMDAFTGGEVDGVRIAFTDFVSSLRQHPRVRTLLPLQRIAGVGSVGAREAGIASADGHRLRNDTNGGVEFLFEPSPNAVLDQLLPRVVELQLYQCYLETGASEHSARMMAMRNASESAGEMISDLTLTFNQARQSLITREIAEISAGRAAVS